MIKNSIAATLAAATVFSGVSFAYNHHNEGEQMQAAQTVVDIAVGNDNFSTLVAAVKAAGLVETLSGEGPFTVFAPTNDAFASLPEGTVDMLLEEENREALQAVLTYHVVSGKVKAADLVRLIRQNDGQAEVATVEGSTLTASIENGDVILTDQAENSIRVVNTDLEASNGVIHVVDTVMLPTGEL